ncbi:MAG: hypothetical protein U9R43_09145 [Thermodesulfobacteriota bacterium]|nr:hypothetical protein [Thermodesulfobacteriota bacterium]
MKDSMLNIENRLVSEGSDQINSLPIITVEKPETEKEVSRKRVLDKLVDRLSSLAYKLLPKHLASAPPPDRQIYY